MSLQEAGPHSPVFTDLQHFPVQQKLNFKCESFADSALALRIAMAIEPNSTVLCCQFFEACLKVWSKAENKTENFESVRIYVSRTTD